MNIEEHIEKKMCPGRTQGSFRAQACEKNELDFISTILC